MDGERLDDSEYAYMDDTEVLEGFAIETAWDEATNRIPWQEYTDQALRDFRSRAVPHG